MIVGRWPPYLFRRNHYYIYIKTGWTLFKKRSEMAQSNVPNFSNGLTRRRRRKSDYNLLPYFIVIISYCDILRSLGSLKIIKYWLGFRRLKYIVLINVLSDFSQRICWSSFLEEKNTSCYCLSSLWLVYIYYYFFSW